MKKGVGSGEHARKKFFFGWWIVVVGFLIMALSFAPSQTMPGLFVKSIADEFGVNRTAVTTIQTVTTLALMAATLVAGRILSKGNIKLIVMLSLALQGGACFLYAAAPSIVLLYVAGVGRGIAVALSGVLPASILINNWFGSRFRGRAWGITMVGSGVGSLVLSPIVGAIMDHFGWRAAFIFFAILSLALIPLVFITYVRNPQDKGFTPIGQQPGGDQATPDTGGIPAGKVLRSGAFWLLLPAGFLMGGSVQTWTMNGAAYLSDLGNSVVQVSLFIAISSVGLSVGKVLLGAINDKFGTRWGMNTGILLLIAGFGLILLIAQLPAVAYPAVALVGLGLAIPTVIIPLITRDLFGNLDYGTLTGFTQAAVSLGASLLPVLTALMYEWTGAYTLTWASACLLCVASVVLVTVAYRRQRPLAQKFWQQ